MTHCEDTNSACGLDWITTCCVSLATLLCCSVVSPQLSDAASRRGNLRLLAVHLSSFILHGSVG